MALITDINKLRKPQSLKLLTKNPVNQGNKFLYRDDENDKRENRRLIQNASVYWCGMEAARDRFRRAWRYRRGQQWDDSVYDPNTGYYVKEKDLIVDSGQIPLILNIIGPNVRSIISQFRQSDTRSNIIARTREDAAVGEMLTNTLKAEYDANNGIEVDCQALEVFLYSGVFWQKETYEYNSEKRKACMTFRNVDFTSGFFNPYKELDQSDLNMMGSFYDYTIDELISKFARNRADEAKLREMFSYVTNDAYTNYDHFTEDDSINRNFYVPNDLNKCRVYDIWENVGSWKYWFHDWAPVKNKTGLKPLTAESKAFFDQENMARLQLALQNNIPPEEVYLIEYKEKFVTCWRNKIITGNYETLWETESPYRHKSHPFTMFGHPLVNGEVWGYVEDVIDMNRMFNRSNILMDFVIGSSAKGGIAIDVNSESDQQPIDEMARQYTKRNGVILFDSKNGQAKVPTELSSKGVPVGLNEQLAMVLNLMNSTSGVSDAAKGNTATAGTPASRYAQEAANSAVNIRNYIDPFNNARCQRDRKLLELIIQFKTEKEYIPVSGKGYGDSSNVFDPSKIRDDIMYTLQVDQGTDSRVYRSMIDDQLFQFVQQGILPLKIALTHSSLPFADKLIADLDEMEKAAQNGQIPQAGGQGLLPGIAKGLQDMGADASKANPAGVRMLQKYAGV